MTVHRPSGRARERIIRALTERDGFVCRWCGISLADARVTLDHLIPRAWGGSNAQSNLVLACYECNHDRGAQSPPPPPPLVPRFPPPPPACCKEHQ